MKKKINFWVHSRPNLKKIITELKIVVLIIFAGIANVLATPGFQEITKVSPDLENTTISRYDLQQKQITGTVTDEKGNPLPGVTVLIKGTTIGSLTDASGKYSINNPPQNATLIFSFVGMAPQEVLSTDRNLIDVIMKEEAIGLDEVVVIGYGTAKKATITGSISSVGSKKLGVIPAINITNRLAGTLPGLTTIQRTSEPGADDASLRIRGINTTGNSNPLIVVDGVAGRGFARIDPGDIESITILKDASAAIYGAQSANGVILVTTKRGVTGKPFVSFNFNHGWSTPTSLPEMCDPVTYMQMVNEMESYRGSPQPYTEETIQMYRNETRDPWLHPETSWYDAVFKPLTPERYGNLSIRGGLEAFKYFISLGTNYQDGIHRDSGRDYRQYNFRTNMDGKISENINLSLDLSGRQSTRNLPNEPYGPSYGMQAVTYGRPNMPARWPNGLPGPGIVSDVNPLITSSDEMGYITNISYIFESNLKLDIKVPWVKGLSFTGNASLDKTIGNNKSWTKPYYLYYWGGYDENNEPTLIKAKHGVAQPQLEQLMSDAQRLTINALIKYDLSINDHSIAILAGAERNTSNGMNITASRKYFPSSAVDQLFAGGDLEKDNSGSASLSARLNYFSRFNYSYMGKYLAEVVSRYDGSYIFHRDYRFGFFPGFSLGWVISEEGFWKNNVPAINFLKIRGSWGQTGNDRINDYQYLSSYGFRSGWGNTYIYNKNYKITALNELRIPYEEITWEVANQTNVGLDLRMLKSKLSISADYFYNRRDNILEYRNASVPLATGFTLPRENIGEVENRGYEFQADYNNEIPNFSYSVSANFGYAKNKILFWDETPGVPDYMKSTGRPIGAALYYQAIGIFRDEEHLSSYPHLPAAKPGDIIFEDVNGDEKIDGLDQVRQDLGATPIFSGGLSIDLKYKNFYTSILFQGAGGFMNYLNLISGEVTTNFYNMVTLNRWTADNPNGTNPRAEAYGAGGAAYWTSMRNTFWLHRGDYLRLRSLEIGYEIPEKVINKIGISHLKIYLSGMNLFTLTGLPDGFDPERISETAWPINKTYNAGVLINF